jgi:hypothetical protein
MGHNHNQPHQAGPPLEVADIFRRYKPVYPLPPSSAKVVNDITSCRTAKLGGHIRKCTVCDYKDQSYNSCRNRHCPKCQFVTRAQWVKDRESELLPIEYFHVVFTTPHVLNPLVLLNKKAFYSILFKASADTLKEVAKTRIGGEIGFVSVLHSWGQNLFLHPHIHMIVAGGALSKNKKNFLPCTKGYLLPLKVLSQVFRGKFLSALEKSKEKFAFKHDFKQLLKQSTKTHWVVYAKKPFAGPKQVINYLGHYTHRIAISNHRLVKLENDHVYFKHRNYKINETKVMALHAKEFMRRFLLHEIPRKFVRIRHYGFLGNRFRKEKVKTLKTLLDAPHTSKQEFTDPKEKIMALLGIDLIHCPKCKTGKMIDQPFIKTKFIDTS